MLGGRCSVFLHFFHLAPTQDDNRAREFRSGLLGVHQVLRTSLATVARVLAAGYAPPADQTPAGCRVFMRAVLHFLDSHHHHEDNIFFPAYKRVLAEFDVGKFSADHEKLIPQLEKLTTTVEGFPEAPTWDQLRATLPQWQAMTAFLLPHLDQEEQVISLEACKKFPAEVVEECHTAVGQANKGDPLGYLGLPLMLWTLEDAHYDLMIRPRMPKFVRAVVCNNIFWYKGASALVPFVPHYRSSWEI